MRSLSELVFFAATSIIAVCGFVLTVYLTLVDRGRDQHVLPFLQLPMIIVEHLRDEAERAVLKLRAVAADDDAEGSDAEHDEGDGVRD